MVSAAFYGMVAYIMTKQFNHRKFLSRFIIAGVSTLVAGIGISRVYLGVHYASDVLAGFFAGGAWGLICVSVFRSLQYRNSLKQERNLYI
jgi:undecaprenyl-diphosphatase